MGLVNVESVRSQFEQAVEGLVGDPTSGHIRPGVKARLVEDVTMNVTFTQFGHLFELAGVLASEHGRDTVAPSPLRYFLTSIALCVEGWWARGSAIVGCELEAVELETRTYLDIRGEHGFAGIASHPRWIVLDGAVSSPSSTERVLESVDWGNARCPLLSLVRMAVPVYERITHNGSVVRDLLPADLDGGVR